MRKSCCLIAVVLVESCALWANVIGLQGSISMDSNNDSNPEAILNSTGLGIFCSPSSNLQVQGNAIVTGSLGIGGAASSNLSVYGTWGQSVQSVSTSALMGDHSIILANTSTSNINLQLPLASGSQGRILNIKKTSTLGTLNITGGKIEQASSLQIPAGGNVMPGIKLINSANVWYVLSGMGLENVVYKRKVFHAKFDETSPNPPVDAVNGFTGLHKNMAAGNIGISGNIGLAVDLDGDKPSTTGDFVTFEPGGVSDGVFDLPVFTLSARIFPRTSLLTADDHGAIIKRGSEATMTYRLSLKVGDNKLYLRVTDINGATQQKSSSSAVSLDTWSHVVGVCTGSALQLYINGVAEGETTLSGNTLVQGSGTGLDIGGSGGATQNFRGKIDDVRIYNYAMTSAEISALFQSAD